MNRLQPSGPGKLSSIIDSFIMGIDFVPSVCFPPTTTIGPIDRELVRGDAVLYGDPPSWGGREVA